mmetsp:Transcript_11274/g.25876  ORF Transcript_11274/g.25876 Transcript_11274/m.25876 type:complete len:491 (-) Transcript_11274:105-1577(-)|eukprot:CAMPEP_0178443366 /NCGR_PEP_ID=MMETSP0689_2-20121128/38846_1 /TAXON_ID=160604 /ORGANISM="Amphidinium massartii, Strain CS-259" /LENGTH=490 /DNA_ID=CAMNT_0020067347 /DNA_START=46 /DNA_END=1518 /DNA_ORIENTATION=-
MGTSDIALERVQAILKIEAAGGSLHDHLHRVVRKLADEKPNEALEKLENLSRHLKQSSFKGHAAPDEAHHIVQDTAAETAQQQWCADIATLARPLGDPTLPPKVSCMVRNFAEEAAMFEWAGVGFSKQESYYLSLSLRKLAMETPGLQTLRFWGKMLGTEADYYVAEGAFPVVPPPATPPPPVIPGSSAFDVEPRGDGANSCTYWVSAGGCQPWVRLPAARASHIVAARQIKRLLTGNLESPMMTMPFFPGKERHFLRAQIARIAATCTLAPAGWYEVDEELGENKFKEAEGNVEAFPGPEDISKQDTWVHAAVPLLQTTGKSTWPDTEALAELISEDERNKIDSQKEEEPAKAVLEPITADLEDLRGENDEGSPAWAIKEYGDKGLYNFGDVTKSYRVTAVKSLIWPGAVTVAQGQKFANIYIGYGMKSGSLVPPDPKTGLPLAGTAPFMPLAPDDIMEEPQDLEEQDEPNPQEDDAVSDQGSVDAEED